MVNTKREKRRFIRELSRNVTAEVLNNVDRMPVFWDGIEIRQYMADSFARAVFANTLVGKRRKAYRNDVLVCGL